MIDPHKWALWTLPGFANYDGKIRRLFERLSPYAPEFLERALSVCHAAPASEG